MSTREGREAAGLVHARAQVAYRAGWQMFHPSITFAEVQQGLATVGRALMTDEERDAFESMMPGTWWAYFGRGWQAAQTEATNDGE